MKVTILIVFSVMILGCGSIQQESPMIFTPTTPRTIIREVPVDQKRPQAKARAQESFSRPDLTRGYIENQAFPYVPRVWMLFGDKKILLVGRTKVGRPMILDWQILEFNLPLAFVR